MAVAAAFCFATAILNLKKYIGNNKNNNSWYSAEKDILLKWQARIMKHTGSLRYSGDAAEGNKRWKKRKL